MITILHHRDADGAAAAVAAYHSLGDTAQYISVQYGEEFPLKDLQPEDVVYILDFSYSREILDRVNEQISKLVVLDHHVSAQKELEGCEYAIFDMSKCGSTLAWEYFRPGEDMYEIYRNIEDRDLFKNELEHTSAVTEGLKLYPIFDIPLFHGLIEDISFLPMLINKGEVLSEGRDSDIEYFLKEKARITMIEFLGHRAAVYNTTALISDISSHLYIRPEIDLTMSYMILNDSVVFNLRTAKDSGISVSDIAVAQGGGGHRAAAGFRMSLTEGLNFLSIILHNPID